MRAHQTRKLVSTQARQTCNIAGSDYFYWYFDQCLLQLWSKLSKNICAEILMRFWRDIQLPDQQHPKKYTLSKYIWKIIKRLHEHQYINVLLTNAIPIFCIFYSLCAYNGWINTLRLQKNFVEDIKYFNPHSFAIFCDFRNFSLKICKR